MLPYSYYSTHMKMLPYGYYTVLTRRCCDAVTTLLTQRYFLAVTTILTRRCRRTLQYSREDVSISAPEILYLIHSLHRNVADERNLHWTCMMGFKCCLLDSRSSKESRRVLYLILKIFLKYF